MDLGSLDPAHVGITADMADYAVEFLGYSPCLILFISSSFDSTDAVIRYETRHGRFRPIWAGG